jgi:hypothetical protein
LAGVNSRFLVAAGTFTRGAGKDLFNVTLLTIQIQMTSRQGSDMLRVIEVIHPITTIVAIEAVGSE